MIFSQQKALEKILMTTIKMSDVKEVTSSTNLQRKMILCS